MKAGAVIKWLSKLDPDEYIAVIWWTREDVKAFLEIDSLSNEDMRHIVNEWEDNTMATAEDMADMLEEVAREVLDV